MVNFFSKLFGRDKSKWDGGPEEILNKAMAGVIEKGGFNLSFEIATNVEGFVINFSGPDSKALKAKDGLLLDAFHIYAKRLLQNRLPGQKIEISVDCEGFLENSAQDLRELTERLKELVLQRGQPAYVRALPPRDRKIVHRYLADDTRFRSKSIGEGFLKKIKITLVDQNDRNKSASEPSEEYDDSSL